MASTAVNFSLLLFLFMFTISISFVKSSVPNKINLGSSLFTTPTQDQSSFWLSPSGNFAFGFYRLSGQTPSFLVGIWLVKAEEKTLVWVANRNDPPLTNGSSLQLTESGKLVVHDTSTNREKLISNVNTLSASASMLDNGNFVLYDSHSKIIWETFKFPTDTIMAGQNLQNGRELISAASETSVSGGRFRLKMQEDGNLVLYPVNTSDTRDNANWATGTNGCGNSITLNLDSSGRLFLLNSTQYSINNITSGELNVENGSFIYRATIGFDGNFRLFAHGFERTVSLKNPWTAVSEPCDIKGFCGFNSYCAVRDLRYPTCRCSPGFSSIGGSSNKAFLNCETNLKTKVCEDSGGINFTMTELVGIDWMDADFPETLLSVREDECKLACQDDCDCLFSLYKNSKCSVVKMNQKLRYGHMTTSDTHKGFFKVQNPENISSSSSSSSSSVPPLFLPNSPKNSSIPTTRSLKSARKWFTVTVILAGCLSAVVSLSIFRTLVDHNRIHHYREFAAHVVTNEVNLRSFTHRELNEATNGFGEELGRGSFGAVFEGTLFDDVKIAVKRLDKVVDEGERQFRTEMNIIGRTHHRNLVRLLGYCDEGSHRLLIYEFMSNGSLADLLFKEQRRLGWEERVRISVDIARGLMYLHEECETQIIHCDIKPSNILLNHSWVPKISDFGLSKILEPDQTRTFTGARGTRGYVAPEWSKNVPITAKVDIYSFGVMLLEIICCRRSLMVNVPVNQIILSDWVYECLLGGNLQSLVAPGEVDIGVEKRRLERMVMVGLWCVQEEPPLRPSMKRVVLMLEGTVDVPVPPHPASQSFGANQTDVQR